MQLELTRRPGAAAREQTERAEINFSFLELFQVALRPFLLPGWN